MNSTILVPLTSSIAAAIGLTFPLSAQASASSPRVESPEPTQPHAQDPEAVESPEGTGRGDDEWNKGCGAQRGENMTDAILNGAKPHRAPRAHPRHRHHWAPFARSISQPALFEEDTVDDIYEIIERYGLSDTSAGRNFGVTSSTMSGWKEADPNFIEFLEIARAKFELDQVHKVESAVRKDGQADSQCARWLLERSLPERWGTPSARRAATPKSEPEPNKGPKPKPPKPGTKEFWDTVEEEPFPREMAGCIVTVGRLKFYSTMHLVALPYMDPATLQPTADPRSELGKANQEAFFRLQDAYFALPREQRLPYLHHMYEQQYGKVLSREQRAATDALVSPPRATPTPANPAANPGAKNVQFDTSQQSKFTPNIAQTTPPGSAHS